MFFWRQEIFPGRWAAFSNAEAGNLALHVGDDPASVLQRRGALEAIMGVRTGSLSFMHQTHSADVAVVEPGDDVGPATGATVIDQTAGTTADVITADALVSDDGAVPLAVMVADCVPVVVSAPGPSGATAVIHAGRQGILEGIVENAIGLLRTHGAQELTAWIGPSICGKCYEVPADLREKASAALPVAWSTTRWGTPGLDLPAAVAAQLNDLEVQVLPLTDSASQPRPQKELCTLENGSLYSHRRSRFSGRFAGLIWTR